MHLVRHVLYLFAMMLVQVEARALDAWNCPSWIYGHNTRSGVPVGIAADGQAGTVATAGSLHNGRVAVDNYPDGAWADITVTGTGFKISEQESKRIDERRTEARLAALPMTGKP